MVHLVDTKVYAQYRNGGVSGINSKRILRKGAQGRSGKDDNRGRHKASEVARPDTIQRNLAERTGNDELPECEDRGGVRSLPLPRSNHPPQLS